MAVKSTNVTGGVAGTVYQQITGINARGQVETEVYGNGVVQSNVYDAPMGWLDNASVTRSGVTHQSYWDQNRKPTFNHPINGVRSNG